jgi:hypothetical protein
MPKSTFRNLIFDLKQGLLTASDEGNDVIIEFFFNNLKIPVQGANNDKEGSIDPFDLLLCNENNTMLYRASEQGQKRVVELIINYASKERLST